MEESTSNAGMDRTQGTKAITILPVAIGLLAACKWFAACRTGLMASSLRLAFKRRVRVHRLKSFQLELMSIIDLKLIEEAEHFIYIGVPCIDAIHSNANPFSSM